MEDVVIRLEDMNINWFISNNSTTDCCDFIPLLGESTSIMEYSNSLIYPISTNSKEFVVSYRTLNSDDR